MKKKKSDFWRTPAALIIMIMVMLAAIIVIVIFSSKKEAEIERRRNGDIDTTPAPTSEIIEPSSPPSEDPVIVTENNDDEIFDMASGTYRNDTSFSVSTGFGMLFTVGVSATEVNDAIYLNPHFTYEYGDTDEEYCYLIKAKRVPVEYAFSNPNTTYAFKNGQYGEAMLSITDFALRGRTYDKVVPAVYVDSNQYGVRWKDNPGIGGESNSGDTVHFLIIRIADGTLMGAAKAEINYNNRTKTYSISALSNADVSETGELTQDQREYLIQESFNFLKTGNDQASFDAQQEILEEQKPFIVVERPGKPYFNKLYDKDGNVIAAGTLSICNVYAVNINYYGIGYYTIYFAPEPQVHGLKLEKMSGDDEVKLVMVGYDAFSPFTVDIFNSFLFPDDISKFGAANY